MVFLWFSARSSWGRLLVHALKNIHAYWLSALRSCRTRLKICSRLFAFRTCVISYTLKEQYSLIAIELERKSYTLKTIHGKYIFESTPLQPCSPLLHFETVTKYKKTEPFSPLVPCVVVLAFFEIPSASVILMRVYWCSQKWNSRLGLPSLQAVASRCLSPCPRSNVRIRGKE